MDIDKFTAGRASGASKIEIHGAGTVLVSWPAGFNPETGNPLAAKEQGYQLDDLKAMQAAAVEAITQAEDALAKAQTRAASFDVLIVEVTPLVAAAQDAERARLEAIALAEAAKPA